MSKQGTEYELFVKDVYECLNRADGLSDVQIQHNITLVGAVGVAHQIDVFWSFTKGGVTYKVAIECKDYKNRVSKEKIAAFHDILQDIGNIHGIFASRMGFQSGARKYAQQYGIQLMEIRHPIDSDWEGRMRNMHLEFKIRSIDNVEPKIFINRAKAEEQGVKLPENNLFCEFTDQVKIHFEKMIVDKNVVAEKDSKTMYDLVNRLPVGAPSTGNQFAFAFENATIHFHDTDYPLDGVVFTYDIYGDEVIKAIVKNITEGTEIHIDRFGRVSGRESVAPVRKK